MFCGPSRLLSNYCLSKLRSLQLFVTRKHKAIDFLQDMKNTHISIFLNAKPFYFSKENSIYHTWRDLMSDVDIEHLQYNNVSWKKVEYVLIVHLPSSIFINSPDDKLNDYVCLLNSENFGKLRPKNCWKFHFDRPCCLHKIFIAPLEYKAN